MRGICGDFVLVISYGNYLQSVGGVDKCILIQQQMFQEAGIEYFYIFDVSHYLKMRCGNLWGVILSGKYEGVFTTEEIIKIVENNRSLVASIVHHFRYMSLSEAEKILCKCYCQKFVYVHDYLMMCSEGHFLCKQMELCSVAGGRETCEICRHGGETRKIVERYRRLWQRINDLQFIAPSETAKKFFVYTFPEEKEHCIVIPHQLPVGQTEIENIDNRMAYIGMPHAIKGYEVWKKICTMHSGLDLYQFGRKIEPLERVTFQKVRYSREDFNPMVSVLRKHKIGIVLLWSICPETYSYTYFEALVSGAFVITNSKSGNIAEAVERYGNGIVLKDENELYNLIQDTDRLHMLLERYYKKRKFAFELLKDNDEILKYIVHDKRNQQDTGIVKKNDINKICVNFLYRMYMLAYKILRARC